MIINLVKEEKPTHIAVAFDVSRKTFRTEKFPEYKATRASTPDEFRSQLSYINELVDAFGIKHLEVAGFEADDIIATLSNKFGKEAPLTVNRRKVHEYLGMDLNFSIPGKVRISVINYIKELLVGPY